MLTKISHNIIAAALAVLCVTSLPCCTRSYYVGELKPADIVGSWNIIEQNANPGKIAAPKAGDLVLHANSKFEASRLPWTNSRDELEYVDEVGEWELIDKKSEGLRSRWKLLMRLTKHRQTVEWDVFISGKPNPYVGHVYDLDTNAAVLFEKVGQ
ncbi:hypothetical protein [Prosthecobacter sp.]